MNVMISCLYVIEDQSIRVKNDLSQDAKLKQRREAEDKLSERVNSILNESRTSFELMVSSGNVREKILEKSRDLNAQLIIMGRSKPKAANKKQIGSLTKHILTKSQVPVISIGRFNMEARENIVVPLDVFKPIGNQIICAIDTAMLLGATVTVISVMELGKLSLRPVYLKRLQEIRQMLRGLNIDCDTHLLISEKSVAEEIVLFSRRLDSAMILLMTGYKNSANASSMGSVARGIIAMSELPVQCLNPNCTSRTLLYKSANFNTPISFSWFAMKDHLINNKQEFEA